MRLVEARSGGFGRFLDATALVGYRALSQDYADGGFRWDMTVHGPLLGLTPRFWGRSPVAASACCAALSDGQAAQ